MIFRTHIFMPLISAAVLYLFTAAEVRGMRMIDVSERVKFCFSKPDPKFDKLQSFLKAADYVTYSMSGLKASDKTALCSVILSNNDMKDGFEINSSGEVLRIFLSDNLSGWEKNYKLHSAVISAMLLSRYGIKPDSNYAKVPSWLIAGIICKMEMRRNPAMLSGVIVYPGVRGFVSGGARPDLRQMFETPLEYGDGPSFVFYSETCAIIIDSISRIPKNRDILMSMLKSAIGGEKPETAFKTAINDYIMKSGFDISTLPVDQIPPDKRVDIWFETAIRNSSINLFYPGSSCFVEKRLDELKVFNYTVAVPAGKDKPPKPEIKSCEIRELGKKWGEMENPERIVNLYCRYFSELSNQSPALLQKEVNRILELLNRLKDGDKDNFERDFKEAETALCGKIAKLRQIEDYMRECESKFVPFGKRYSPELKYLDETGTFTGRFFPLLNSILDKEEKSF